LKCQVSADAHTGPPSASEHPGPQAPGAALNIMIPVSVYSSGAIGRLVPEDVIGLVRYLREHAAASAG